MGHHYLIFSARFAPLTGGVESYTQNLATELAHRGNHVSIVTSRLTEKSCDHELLTGDIDVWRLPAHGLMGARLPVPKKGRAYRDMSKKILASGADRVLVNTRFYAHSLEGLDFAAKLGAPTVVLDHGSAYLVLGNPLADRALAVYEHGMTLFVKRARPVFAGVSAKSCAWLETFGIHTKNVLPNAIDAHAFRAMASGRSFRQELGIQDDKTLVCFCGRLESEKGALTLAQAARLSGEDFAFVFAGEGSERPAIEALRLPQVHLLGTVSHRDLSSLMAEADLFCLPTRSEGFCTSVLEAASWGLPAAITDVGGVREVYGQDPKLAKILASREPELIEETLADMRDQGLTGHFSELMHDVEEHHGWSETARRLENLFEGA